MRKFISFSLIITLLMLSNISLAQVSHGGTPYFNHAAIGMKSEGFKTPIVDHKKLLDEDALHVKGAGGMRVGVMQDVNIDVINEAEVVRNTTKTHYLMSITSPGATSISLKFSEFELPDGAELFFYDASGKFVLGSFNKNDVQPDGTFYIQAVPGEKIFVEYTVPFGVNPGKLTVNQVVHRYKNILNLVSAEDYSEKGPHGTAQGSCHPNVICPEGDGWRDEIRSVVALEIHTNMFAYMCSGTLINNTKNDFTPYILSANHCYEDDQYGATFQSLICYFLYETYSCEGNTGVSNKSMTGGQTVAHKSENGGSDFWLIKMNQNVPDEYTPYYAGWDRSEVTSHTPGMAIHHPGGDYKKLSIPQEINGTTGLYKDFWVVKWLQENNKGVTEEGSSGSGIFNASHRLVGTLTGGYSYCNDLSGLDYYGRFDVSWNRGTDNASSLRHWLDPDETGALTCQGLNYDGTVGIESYEKQQVSYIAYPNPADDFVTISPADFNRTDVYDIQGRKVLSSTTATINIANLPAGVYIFKIISNEGETIQRIVKK